MSYRITIPFPVFVLEFNATQSFITPLQDGATLRFGQSVEQLTREYQEGFQKALYDNEAIDILQEYHSGTFRKDTIAVNFPAAKDGIRYPAFTIEFDIYIQEKENAFWGILPVLGIQAFAKNLDKLQERLAETAKVDFARHRRGRHVKNLIEVLWYTGSRMITEELEVQIPDPGEENQKEKNKEQLLPRLGNLLQPGEDWLYGRTKELEQIKRSLSGHFNQSILLVGPSGVGKSALVQETVRRLSSWNMDFVLWETTAAGMMKALVGEQSWEYNIGRLISELKGTSNMLFVRNLMELFEVGKYEGNDVSMGAFLQPFLNRGELKLITECTDQEFSAIELNNPNYVASFQIIRLEQPKEKELLSMIEYRIARQAKNLGVTIDPAAILESVRLSQRFTPYAGLPGRPIRFLENLMLNHSFRLGNIARVDVIRHFCAESGMPSFMVDPSVPMNPEAIQRDFNEQVFSQEEAIASVVDAMAAVKTALTRTGKPIASFLFVGPTGVGKTELAKILAQFLFGQRNRMLRFDMSEFSSPAGVLRLTGGLRPGEDGLLTSAIRRDPFSVLLFDEIEKADESFYDLLLQILSEGRLTDSRGRLANFCSALIIMTSNIGANQRRTKPIQMAEAQLADQEAAHYQKAVQQYFRPELYNRIDRIIPFQSLDRDTVQFVVERELHLILNREGIRFRKVQIDIKEPVLDRLVKEGFHPAYGARHLQRTLREKLVIPLAEKLNTQEADDQIHLVVFTEGEKINLDLSADPLAIELLIEELKKQQNTDFASSLRRKIHGFVSGYFYTLIQQEIDQFEEQIKLKKEAFWILKQEVERYWLMVDLRDRSLQLRADMDKIENDLSLMMLQMKPYRPSVEMEMDTWSEVFFNLRLDIFVALHPQQNRCFFHIYGDDPEEAALWYTSIFDRKQFLYTISALYTRDSQYQLYLNDQNRPPEQQSGARPFVRRTIPYRNPDFKPEQASDKLVGVEFTVSGKACLAYLQPEEGGQSWQDSSTGREKKIKVIISEHYEQAPPEIGRKDYVKKPEIRRLFSPAQFKDSEYRISREMDREKVQEQIILALEDAFRRRIDREVH